MDSYDGVIGILKKAHENKYLLLKNHSTGNISFPAGGREEGETEGRVTLEREVREETGLIPSQYRIVATPLVHEFIYGPKKKERAGQRARQLVYLLETAEKVLHPIDPDAEILGWFTEKEVEERLTFPDSKELFKKVIER